MEILKSAAAGTLESSDCMVTVEPGEGITLDLSSSVMNQYGRTPMSPWWTRALWNAP